MINFEQRWRLYIAGLTVDQIKLREQAIRKQVEVGHKISAFLEAQDDLQTALRTEKSYQKALSAADAAFIALSVRRGQLL
jgi:cell fate (sporulation/competence/biofilm development) regulator YlbF (YheA/YmcA/DUF963 family)